MSIDMRLLTVSDETGGFGRVRIHGCGRELPTWLKRGNGPGHTAAYVTPPSEGPSCRLPTAAISPVTDEIACRGAEPASVAGHLLAGSIVLPVLASSLALSLSRSAQTGLLQYHMFISPSVLTRQSLSLKFVYINYPLSKKTNVFY